MRLTLETTEHGRRVFSVSRLKVQDDGTSRRRLEKALYETAGGMFRWVEIWLGIFFPVNRKPIRQPAHAMNLLADLEKLNSLDRLAKLEGDKAEHSTRSPRNQLSEAYRKLWDLNGDEQYKDLQVTAFRIVMGALEALSPQALLEAISLIHPDALLELDELQGLYHNFLKVDSQGSLTFEHHSAKLFISEIKEGDPSVQIFSETKCNLFLADLIIDAIKRHNHPIWSNSGIDLNNGSLSTLKAQFRGLVLTTSYLRHYLYQRYNPPLVVEAVISQRRQHGKNEEATHSVCHFLLLVALGISPFTRDDTPRPRLSPGFDIDDITSNNLGSTAMHIACRMGSVAIVTDLLEYTWAEMGSCAYFLEAMDYQSSTLIVYLRSIPPTKVFEDIIKIMLEFEQKEAPQVFHHGLSVSRLLYGNAGETGDYEIIAIIVHNSSDAFLEWIFSTYTPSPGEASLSRALVEVVGRGSAKLARTLLGKGADPNFISYSGRTSLWTAIECGYIELLELLLDNGASFDYWFGQWDGDEFYMSPLQLAATHLNPDILQFIHRHVQDIDSVLGEYGTALAEAAHGDHTLTVKFLLEQGADINASGGWLGTALAAAASKGDFQIAQLLLEKGADINANGTVLEAAAFEGQLKMIRFLIAKGANINSGAGEFGTPLIAAMASGCCDVELAEFLIEQGVDINADGGQYGTAIAAAASRYGITLVELLLARSADINFGGREYGTPLVAAAATPSHQIELLEFFLNQGLDINASKGMYGTALAGAAYYHSGNIPLLLERGADINAKGGKWGTPLGAALHNPETVRYETMTKADVLNLFLSQGADRECLGEEDKVRLGNYIGNGPNK
ncbi:ankyrin repeat-containing domain protein [Xylaria arbuscula]|nr:ankyrin repeat-containing domain protein [Xylaria arbuscula]